MQNESLNSFVKKLSPVNNLVNFYGTMLKMHCFPSNRREIHPLQFAIVLLALMKTVYGQTEDDVRLTDPGNKCNKKKACGRVEVFYDGDWGTICNNYWDFDDARVVCCQLGYPAALSAFKYEDKDTIGKVPIWLDNVRCEGVESQLEDCVFNGWGLHTCPDNHTVDAGVECKVDALPNEVGLRLYNSSSEPAVNEGFVQLYDDSTGKWEYICIPDWGITESHVVCRQLETTAAVDFFEPLPSEGNENIVCSGNEPELTDCNLTNRKSKCGKDEAIRVTCSQVIPDSMVDSLYNPAKFAFQTIPNRRGNVTLGDILDMGCSGIPAEKSTESTHVTCDRRAGCFCQSNCSQEYTITVNCLRENAELSLCSTNEDGLEYLYAPGETIKDTSTSKTCYARTCLSDGTWQSDDNVQYCEVPETPIGPPQHECFRDCEDPPLPRICDFGVWNTEFFVAGESDFCKDCLHKDIDGTYRNKKFKETMCPQCLLVDGYTRMAAVVNRMIPGPAMHVCEGDQVIVKVVNSFIKDPTATVTLHWHGMFQRGTPYVDGTFMVTQCPIPINEQFTYNFTANPHGTHWWHSHAGLQYVDGVSGPIIVRRPKKSDPNWGEYEFDMVEHVIFIQDWYHVTLRNLLVPEFYGATPPPYKPKAILINGRGGQSRCEGNEDADCKVPRYAQFNVTAGKRYRFRTINAVASRQCSLTVSVDNHNLTIIATDGASTKPKQVKSFTFFNAERYDFVLNATQPHPPGNGNYWLRVEGQKRDQGNRNDRCEGLRSLAIIHYVYDTSELKLDGQSSDVHHDVHVNPCGNFTAFNGLAPNAPEPSWNNDKVTPFYLGIQPSSQGLSTTTKFLPRLNNVTFCLPPTPFLLQKDSSDRLGRCNPENATNRMNFTGVQLTDSCGEGYCDCSHVLDVELNTIVELVFVNVPHGHDGFLHHISSTCHPFHLHATNYRVVAQGTVKDITMEKVRRMNENGMIKKKSLFKAIQKDTMVAPISGYTIVQFKADNPGWWFFHCHYDVHLALGMAVVFHVDNSTSSKIPTVPNTFPKCGDWPFNRDSDGEAYLWNEEMDGRVPTASGHKSPYREANNIIGKAMKDHLLKLFNRTTGLPKSVSSGTHGVIRYRIRTDPVAGFHYFLVKIDTGDICYIHLQVKMLTNSERRNPVLQACEGCEHAESPLIPLNISSVNNMCRPLYCSRRSAGNNSFHQMSVLQLLVLLLGSYLFINLNIFE